MAYVAMTLALGLAAPDLQAAAAQSSQPPAELRGGTAQLQR